MKHKQVVIKMQNTKLKFNYLTAWGTCMLSRLSNVYFNVNHIDIETCSKSTACEDRETVAFAIRHQTQNIVLVFRQYYSRSVSVTGYSISIINPFILWEIHHNRIYLKVCDACLRGVYLVVENIKCVFFRRLMHFMCEQIIHLAYWLCDRIALVMRMQWPEV